jgi:predicted enzyme related to lactoylglutathione lyase
MFSVHSAAVNWTFKAYQDAREIELCRFARLELAFLGLLAEHPGWAIGG